MANALWIVAFLSLVLAPMAAGADTAKRPAAIPGIIGADDRRPQDPGTGPPWSAIGRVNRESGGFCTGTLIAADKVLTAAHCLFNHRTHRLLPPNTVHFAAGWWGGRYLAQAAATSYVTPPELAFASDGSPRLPKDDWAVLVLATPLGSIAPLALVPPAAAVAPLSRLTRAGYGRDHPHQLRRQSDCHALGWADDGRLLLHDCDATFGDSGSPILLKDGAGYRLLALHLGSAAAAGEPVGTARRVVPAMLGLP